MDYETWQALLVDLDGVDRRSAGWDESMDEHRAGRRKRVRPGGGSTELAHLVRFHRSRFVQNQGWRRELG
jgi:hypothetical protein